MSVRAASSNNTAESKYDMLVSSMTSIATTHLCSTRAYNININNLARMPLLGFVVISKKIPTHTQDHGDVIATRGESVVHVPS